MIAVLITLVIAGVILWLVNTLVPMDPKFKLVVNVVACVFLLLYILDVFGIWNAPALK